MNSLANLTFQSHAVRTFEDNGNPWFLANDICSILGYSNPRQAIAKNCKEGGVSKRDTPTTSGNQEMIYINEGNLYRLIVKSRKPEAEKFEAWVMEEVLPTIRKTGAYTLTINPEQQRAIQEAVNAYVIKHQTTHQTVYHSIKTKFKVAKYVQLPASQYSECMDYLEGKVQPAIEAQPRSANFLADFPNQIGKGNSYPDEVLLPIYRSLHGHYAKDFILMEKARYNDTFAKVNQLASMVNMMGMHHADVTQKDWQRHSLAA